MRKYTRKKITLKDVSGSAIRPKRTPDELDIQVAKLKASGWMDRREPEVPKLEAAFTYTGMFPTTKPKPKGNAWGEVIVIKRSREKGERTERRGKLYLDGKGRAD